MAGGLFDSMSQDPWGTLQRLPDAMARGAQAGTQNLFSQKPGGAQAPTYSQPTLDRGDFTGTQAAQLGAAPQGRSLVQQYGGAQADGGAQGQSRGQLQDLMGYLRGQYTGQSGPSAAQGMFQRGSDRAVQNAMSLYGGQRGGPAGMGAYMAAGQAGQGTQDAAQQAAIQRAQEQQQAQALYGQLAGQMRGQDQSWAQANADRQQQAGMFNAGQYNGQVGQDMSLLGQYGLAQGGFDQGANLQNGMGSQAWAMGSAGNQRWTQEQQARFQDMLNQYYLQQKSAQQDQLRGLETRGINGGMGALGSATSIPLG